MSASIRIYSFPKLSQFTASRHPVAQPSTPPEVEAAIRSGYEDGVARGREAAAIEAAAAIESAREKGREEAHQATAGEIARATDALHDALAQLKCEQGQIRVEAEEFAVKIALAAIDRIVGNESVRTAFVERVIKEAVQAFAPERPHQINLNPADISMLGDALAGLQVEGDSTLAPGTVRIDAGDLFVAGSVDEAFAKIRQAVIEIETRRLSATRTPRSGAKQPQRIRLKKSADES